MSFLVEHSRTETRNTECILDFVVFRPSDALIVQNIFVLLRFRPIHWQIIIRGNLVLIFASTFTNRELRKSSSGFRCSSIMLYPVFQLKYYLVRLKVLAFCCFTTIFEISEQRIQKAADRQLNCGGTELVMQRFTVLY